MVGPSAIEAWGGTNIPGHRVCSAPHRASAVEPTQAEAIERAKEINNGGPVLVERVRNTDVGTGTSGVNLDR